MADTGITVEERGDLCANQLLNFVSNASKQLKSLLGEVDEDLQPSHVGSPTHSLPSPQFLSPVPSPTPSSVSSMSEQEVPSMSPGLLVKKAQRRGRKRNSDSINEATMVEYPNKARRADSLGDYDEYATRVAANQHQLWIQPTTRPSSQLQSYTYKTYNSCQYDSYDHYQTLHTRQQLASQQHQPNIYNINNTMTEPCFPNQTSDYFSNCLYEQQQENMHEFADMVSWMIAENVVDYQTLTALLNQC